MYGDPILILTLLVVVFWIIREVKAINFWLYLWQLKEYHIGRFLDHFKTHQGRRLIFSWLIGLKFTLLLSLYAVDPVSRVFDPEDRYELHLLLAISVLLGIFFLYFFEVIKTIIDHLRRRMRLPVSTPKIMALRLLLFAATVAIPFLPFFLLFFDFPSFPNPFSLLLLYDLFLPLVVSFAVLFFQPFAMLARGRILALAKTKRESFKNLKVIGITGSYGKTTTKELLVHILSVKFRVLKTKEHQNSEVGISQCILNDLKPEHEVFVCEMGAYNKGGIKLLADIVKPHIGIVTGVNEQHLALFGSMENLLSAEGGKELIEALPEGGVALINQNSKFKVQNYNAKCKILYYGVGEKADLEAQEVKVEKEAVSFRMEGVPWKVSVYGGHNVQNLVGAIAAARELGMSLEEIAKACETITPDIGALKVKKGVGGITVIDSTYSANPDGVIADLEYSSLYEGKKILVMPCLIELGKASREVHRSIGKKIGEVCDLAIITSRDMLGELREGAVRQRIGGKNILLLEEAQEIVDKIGSFCSTGDVVLLEGRVPQGVSKLLE